MMRVLWVIAAAMALTGLFCTMNGVAHAEDEAPKHYIYQWIDDSGNAHIVDSLEKVPMKYRGRAQVIDQEPSEPAREEAAPTMEQNAPSPENEQMLRSKWQERLLNAKQRLASYEERYRQLEKRKEEVQSQWGSAGAALPPQSALDEINLLTSEIEKVQKEIEAIEHEIDVIIPDEARKAGVPPGWLREVQ